MNYYYFPILLLIAVSCNKRPEANTSAEKWKKVDGEKVVSVVELLQEGGFEKFADSRYSRSKIIFKSKNDNRFVSIYSFGEKHYIIISQPEIIDMKWLSESEENEFPVSILRREKILVSGIEITPEGRKVDDFASPSEAFIGYKFKINPEMKNLKVSYAGGYVDSIELK